MSNCKNCRANEICDVIAADCEQTDKIVDEFYQQGRADGKEIGIQQAIDSALDFLFGACIQVNQQEMERYIKVMCEKKGYEV